MDGTKPGKTPVTASEEAARAAPLAAAAELAIVPEATTEEAAATALVAEADLV